MDNDLAKKVQARLEELPADIQKAVQSADLDKKIQAMGTKHALHIDQVAKLSDETYLVMLGFTDAADFADNLAQHVNIPAEKAELVAQDIGTSIFIPIRESMQQFTEEGALQNILVQQKTSPPPAPAAAIKPPLATPPPVLKAIGPHPADLMLTQKTVTAAPPVPAAPKPATPPTPQPYKADPYREKPE